MGKCRLCTECEKMSHHWMENPDCDDENVVAEFACKHCEALGSECLACGGDGVDLDELEGLCRTCDGEGVTLNESTAKPKVSAVQAERKTES